MPKYFFDGEVAFVCFWKEVEEEEDEERGAEREKGVGSGG